jgi:CubicO group peptidase (beta-lactamase class C family)
MSTPGLNTSRFDRLRAVLAGYVERRAVPGLVALVSHNDDSHVEVLGTLAFDQPEAMQRDTIFRIASISKVVAAAAAMILIEDCKLRLDDSIDRWLPELANRRVLKTLASPLDDTVPARRAITVRDVLTYTLGFGSIMAPPGTYPIQQVIRDYKIGGDRPMLPNDYPPTDEWLKRLGSLPWLAQPGERWMYHVSGDVLGILIARVSGQTLGGFLKERVFGPLGMKDTGFQVPPESLRRLPRSYQFNQQTKTLDVWDDAMSSVWAVTPLFESAAGGLVSTVDDYFAFSRMLLNNGRSGREQILSRAAVELMSSDQVTLAQRMGQEIFLGTHASWGLGMSVDIQRDEIFHVPGRYGWDGGFGTTARVDPREGMIGILFTQRSMDSPTMPEVYQDFWTLAYGLME